MERLARFRGLIVTTFVAASLLGAALLGLPDRPYVVMWLVVLLLLVCGGSPRPAARFVIDWLPILVIAAGYDFVRSFATDLVPRAMVEPQLRFDEILFGGTAPTVRLQAWLRPAATPHPWDYLVFVFYLSHFMVTPAVAIYLYVTDRTRFKRFAWLILTMTLAGFVTYFALPAVPPWLASRHGDLGHSVRVVQRIWAHLGATGPAKVFNGDAKLANPVAAIPSEHAAWPFMILLFFWRSAPRGRWVALAFNIAMALVLVYGAEHYFADVLLGWLYSSVTFVVVNRLLDRRAAATALHSQPA